MLRRTYFCSYLYHSSICTSTKTSSVESAKAIVLRHSVICLFALIRVIDICKIFFFFFVFFFFVFFFGCSNFTNIAYGDYCFELRRFNIMRQVNTEIVTNSVIAFFFFFFFFFFLKSVFLKSDSVFDICVLPAVPQLVLSLVVKVAVRLLPLRCVPVVFFYAGAGTANMLHSNLAESLGNLFQCSFSLDWK